MNRPTRKALLKKIQEFKELALEAPDPNAGRIEELKELIRKGKLVTKESIRESAMRIAERFLGLS